MYYVTRIAGCVVDNVNVVSRRFGFECWERDTDARPHTVVWLIEGLLFVVAITLSFAMSDTRIE
jgi:hypothetical protein